MELLVSRPGMYHSQTPQSQHEMKNHRILENDINVNELFPVAEAIGFTDFRIAALCRPLLDFEEHNALLKGDFQPDLTNKVIHECGIMELIKISFLHKGPLLLDSRSVEGLRGNLEVLSSTLFSRVEN